MDTKQPIRLNQFLASGLGIGRRAADALIANHQVFVNQRIASLGQKVTEADTVVYQNQTVTLPDTAIVVLLNKPVGYVCSRNGQGAPTIYELLPKVYSQLKPIGRLDKDSSGLLVLTNNGKLAQSLAHPSKHKTKEYIATLSTPLLPHHQRKLEHGVHIDDTGRLSSLKLTPVSKDGTTWKVTLHEGRNRQIRKSFAELGYTVQRLHREVFGPYSIKQLADAKYMAV